MAYLDDFQAMLPRLRVKSLVDFISFEYEIQIASLYPSHIVRKLLYRIPWLMVPLKCFIKLTKCSTMIMIGCVYVTPTNMLLGYFYHLELLNLIMHKCYR